MDTIKIYLIRHGKAAAGFAAHHDPGLDDLGRAQAEAAARAFAANNPLPIISSPMARAVETALPLARRWSIPRQDIQIEPRVAEIPSPTDNLQARAQWLANAMQGTWDDLPAPYQQWRADLADCLLTLPGSCIIFSHYVAINAAVGLALDDSRMRIFAPDNASVTTLVRDQGQLTVASLGDSADTVIN